MENIECTKDNQKFITKLTHDLKSPLHNIIGFANLLEIKYKKDQNPKALNYLNIITQEAEHSLKLINTLSLYLKELSGDMEMEKKSLLENLLEDSKKEHEKTVIGV
jgi:signal transduction histidine kinase